MNIIKWRKNELDPLTNFFNSTWGLTDGLVKDADWQPSVDITEEDDKFLIKADIPGVKQSDIDVSLKGDVLTIKGQKKKEEEVKSKKYYRLERFSGTFTRSFILPDYVDSEKVSADYKDGTLNVLIPKTEKVQPKDIKINVN